MSFAGLGLRLHDITYGTDLHRAFATWWEHAKVYYVPQQDGRMIGPVTMYYDPIIDCNHNTEAQGPTKLAVGLSLGPQYPEATRVMVNSGIEAMGWMASDDLGPPAADPRPLLTGIFFAREYGDEALLAKLQAHSEAYHEPTWDEVSAEFTWRFGLDEPHPRGQYNATGAMAEATTEGAWWRLFNEPNLRKFIDPTVYGVDFPTVCLSQATYDEARRMLVVATDAGVPAERGKPTTFRVTNVVPGRCSVVADGKTSDDWREVDGDLEVSTTVGTHTFLIRLA